MISLKEAKLKVKNIHASRLNNSVRCLTKAGSHSFVNKISEFFMLPVYACLSLFSRKLTPFSKRTKFIVISILNSAVE